MRLNELERFEYSFPFYRMRVDRFVGRVTRFVRPEDEESVTIRQLQYAFDIKGGINEAWKDLQDEQSQLYRLITMEEFNHQTKKKALSVEKLIILGVMMCGGSDDMKARVLYDAVQDDMQAHISAGDKDFKRIFKTIILVSCYVLPKFYRTEMSKHSVTDHFPIVGTEEYEQVVDEFKEDFFDEVYENESILTREKFLTKVSIEANWIFKIDQVRRKYSELLE